MGKVITFPTQPKKKQEDGLKQAMEFMAETSLIHAFLALTTKEQVGAFLFNHPEMLSERVRRSLYQYSQMAFGEEARYMKRRHRFLTKCAQEGLESVYPHPERLPIKVQPMPDEVDHILDRLDKPSHIQALDETARRLNDCRRGLNMFKKFEHPLYWSRLKMHEADALSQAPGHANANIQAALAIYDEVEKVLKRDAQPFRWSQLMEGRAVALTHQKTGERMANLALAANCLERAVKVVRDLGNAGLTGRYQYKLAGIYRKLKDAKGKPRLAEAAACMQEAVVILGFDRKEDPYPFAAAQVELADLLLAQTGAVRMEYAEKALGYLRDAAAMHELKRSPSNWAHMQKLRGDAAMRLSGRTGLSEAQAEEYLEEALTAFTEALEAVSKEGGDRQIKAMKKRLAKAYQKRLKGNPEDNRQKAEALLAQAN